MVKLKNTLLPKILFLVCVVALNVAMLPHHHHGDSEVVCFSINHCSDDGCADGHSHDDACCADDGGSCPFDELVFHIPEAGKQADQDWLPECDHTHGCLFHDDSHLNYTEDTPVLSKRRLEESSAPVYIKYVSKALPARAPNLIS